MGSTRRSVLAAGVAAVASCVFPSWRRPRFLVGTLELPALSAACKGRVTTRPGTTWGPRLCLRFDLHIINRYFLRLS